MTKLAASRRSSPKRARRRAVAQAVTPDAEGRVYVPDGRWYYVHDGEPSAGEDGAPELWERDERGRARTWWSQARLAAELDISTRWLQKLEAKGLPARGFRETCEYPIPDAFIWHIQYERRKIRDGSVVHLSMDEARAEWDREIAIEEAEIDYQMATDPLYREWMEAELADDPRAEELLHRLWDRDGWPAGARRRSA